MYQRDGDRRRIRERKKVHVYKSMCEEESEQEREKREGGRGTHIAASRKITGNYLTPGDHIEAFWR